VLVDLSLKQTIRNEDQITKSGWSPWHGQQVTGWPVSTWVMGNEVYNRGQFNSDRCGREARFDHARGGYWATI
jgi:dihydroorotase